MMTPAARSLQIFGLYLLGAGAVSYTHLDVYKRQAWARSGRADPGTPVLVRAAHWMTHVEYDAQSPIFRPWLERLGRGLRLVNYDERGCGLSGPDDTPLDLAAALEELEVVVQASAEPKVALLGISGGAATAVGYAALHPERVSHLVLLGGYTHGLLQRFPTAEGLSLIHI